MTSKDISTKTQDTFVLPLRHCPIKNCFTRTLSIEDDIRGPWSSYIEMILFILGLIYPKPRIRPIRAKSAGLNGSEPDSELGLVWQGKADLTLPNFYVLLNRDHFSNAGILFISEFSFIYVDFPVRGGLGAFDLMLKPIGLWTVLVTCIVSLYVCKRIFRKERKEKSRQKNQERICGKARRRFYTRLKFNFSFWSGIVLSAIGSYVIVIFVRAPANLDPIRDLESLKDQVYNGHYEIMFVSDAEKKMFFQRVEQPYRDIFERKTRTIKDINEGMGILEQDRVDQFPHHVFILDHDQSEWLQSAVCNLKVIHAPHLGNTLITSYLRPGLKLNLNGYLLDVIKKEYQRSRSRKNPHKFCPKQQGDPNTLDIVSVDGALAIFLFLQSVAIFLFIAEKIFHIRFRQKQNTTENN